MLHPLELSELQHRLDRVADRMMQARTGFSATHPEFESDLATFIDRHDSIRSLIDETTAKAAISTAERATTDLESGFESWLKSIDEKFANPPRVQSVSM